MNLIEKFLNLFKKHSTVMETTNKKILSKLEIRDLCYDVGFRGKDLDTAVAVAMAESSGRINAYNPEDAAHTPKGLGSYGLFQIYLKAHPEFKDFDLYDAKTNVSCAFDIYNQKKSFTAWSTFKSGAYLQYV